MSNNLIVYLNKRLHQQDHKYVSANAHPGPVICISREVGCGGLNLAKLLAAELDKHCTCTRWKVLSKEILQESARELNMEPARLRNYLSEGNRSLFDDILTAFSEKRYKSDKKIIKTLVDLIFSFATDGHCIIVGRAGHIIAGDIEKSLLVKISAPYQWRVKQIMEKNKLNFQKAVEMVDKLEKKRDNFRKRIAAYHKKTEEFDLTINLSRMKMDEVVSLIQFTAQTKGFFEAHKSKVEVF